MIHTACRKQRVSNRLSFSPFRVQTILRREGVENPYEKLKEATRGQYITAEVMETFIEGLAVDDNVKRELLRVKPNTFLGVYPTS